ncbi:hypothetical protein C5748_18440 [Phyllobacterium phragmitis]|uniref:Uncharacterized protein n=1 Tax=Phyllobacterium phragmitis TaxID=2670329 RepID=A0A2S9INN2_9HYPH|nr:hypothetical protein [Phyllobacterium phragmitis]PRD42128.1 hypothetical protein C5748_18440 [Phyllobacterium phragmitis]
MSETEIKTRPREIGIDPELQAMLDYFGERVETVIIEHEANGMTARSIVNLKAPKAADEGQASSYDTFEGDLEEYMVA